jgi:P27 family predicted phage terminase small subunit
MANKRPEPRALRLAKGNTNHKPLPPEDQAVRGRPSKPADLSARGSIIWDRVIKNIDGVGLLYVDDGDSIRSLVEAIEIHEVARVHILGTKAAPVEQPINRIVSVNDNGGSSLSAEYRAMSDAYGRVMRGLAEFGLTPSSRVRLAVAQAKKGSGEPDLDDFLEGKKPKAARG